MKWKQDLKYDIRTNTPWDDKDGDVRIMRGENNPFSLLGGWQETSELSREVLKDRFTKVLNNCSAILEIGISRNGDKSFTQIFLKNKKRETCYIGIDIDDKSYLVNQENNVYTIRNSSSNVMENKKWILEIFEKCNLKRKKFDFIFIDGWHSINQMLLDWEYTDLLSENGIVGFHDTAYHPGPKEFVKALNTDIWFVEKNAIHNPADWGIGFAWKKGTHEESGYIWNIEKATDDVIQRSV